MGFRFKAMVLSACLTCSMTAGGLQAAQPNAAGSAYYVVQQRQGVPNVSLGGTVVPYKEVTLAAQLPGRVNYLAGIEGDRFKEEDLLVELDANELMAKRQAALAQLANADAQLRNAGVQYNRELWSPKSKSSVGGMGVPNLFDQMFTRPFGDSFSDRDQNAERTADIYSSRTNIQQAQNTILRVQAEIQAIDAKLRDTKSLAPFDGVIMKKFVEVGDTVQPGQPLLKYADVEYLQIVVDVPGRLRPGLNEGMMLRAELDVGDREVPVRVAQIFPMADAQRHTVTIKFDLPQGVSAPGMYAKVLVPDFNAPARASPVIPNTAIRYNGSLPGVYVEGEDGRPTLRLIRLGEKLSGGYSTVLSGLQAGERVLRNPPPDVTSGWSTPQH
jgi:multidrug efflux pump subunit AcrA (membrane-fusion protein)